MQSFQDRSTSTTDTAAGFQFEFRCEQCGKSWTSPFTPYRTGQASGLLALLGRYIGISAKVGNASSGLANLRSSGAREKALAAAQQMAAQRFHDCSACGKSVDAECWDAGEGRCTGCVGAAARAQPSGAGDSGEATAHRCPNCQSPTDGGRFCAECGYDMATTHKSCPGCGALHQRQARFCTDCGHAF